MHPRAAGVRLVESLVTFAALLTLIAALAASIAFLNGLSIILFPLLQVVLLCLVVVFIGMGVLAVTGRQIL